MTEPFVPSNYLEKIKPPYITGLLVVVGAAILGVGIVMLFATYQFGPTIWPYALITAGIALIFVSSGYFLGRRVVLKMAKSHDEMNFKNWVALNFNVTLTNEQLDELYNYGSTVTEKTSLFLRREFNNDGTAEVYVNTENDFEEISETGLITIEEYSAKKPLHG